MVQSFNVAAAKPADVRLSPDGSRLYSAGTDGNSTGLQRRRPAR